MLKEHSESSCKCHQHHDHNEHNHNEHEHHHTEDQNSLVKIHTHDTSIIGSFQIELSESIAIAEEKMETCLKNIADSVNQMNGIIGHIKGFIQYNGDNCMLSITDEEVNKKRGLTNKCVIDAVAIVFNLEPDQLKKVIEKELGSFENKYRL
ncbi:hypothetical protein Q5O24_05685 [Eubacteriaceae bacterium ES3]|nr:hypothetical protein Q5O24_05685 [Eubacteriaceae bacterium ES3]